MCMTVKEMQRNRAKRREVGTLRQKEGRNEQRVTAKSRVWGSGVRASGH